jgi:hypothetical protein
MICIITGDIVGSRKIKDDWLMSLKNALAYVSKEELDWEIFRGDSFQLKVNIDEAMKIAIYIKACVKANKTADVRMGLGFGEGDVKTKLTEANGEAFINSGSAFDGLKQQKVNLAVKTNSADFDEEMNIIIALALIAMDDWGVATAEIVKLALENENKLQSELAIASGRTQSSVSEALKRAHFNDIMDMDKLYRKKIKKLVDGYYSN